MAILAKLTKVKDYNVDITGFLIEMKEFAAAYGIFTTFCFFAGLGGVLILAWKLPDIITAFRRKP